MPIPIRKKFRTWFQHVSTHSPIASSSQTSEISAPLSEQAPGIRMCKVRQVAQTPRRWKRVKVRPVRVNTVGNEGNEGTLSPRGRWGRFGNTLNEGAPFVPPTINLRFWVDMPAHHCECSNSLASLFLLIYQVA